jgi:hypothetical protein
MQLDKDMMVVQELVIFHYFIWVVEEVAQLLLVQMQHRQSQAQVVLVQRVRFQALA